jgi:Phosphotransferase enzyme family
MNLESPMAMPIDALIAGLGDLPAIRMLHDGQWQRTFGRIEAGPNPTLVLAYEKPQERSLRIQVSATETAGARRDSDDAWITIASCSDDPALPTLPRALKVYQCDQIIRYRPGKRCTFRGIAGGRPAFIKVLADDRGAMIASDAAALARGRHLLDFDIADCLGWDRPLKALTHVAIEGRPVPPLLLAGDGKDLASRIGHSLASLPKSGIKPGYVFGAKQQMKRTAKYAKKLRKLTPRLAPLSNKLVNALAHAHVVVPDTSHGTIHGSPHPHQWLENHGRLALVDFDRLSLGPIEIDAATFVAELDFEAGGMPAESEAFLTAYARRMQRLDRRLLTVYRAHKHFAKAFKSALSIDPNREARAERILRDALRLLQEGLR